MGIITEKSEEFLFKYLNNSAPTGYEAPGQKIWLDYIRPYIDDYHVDAYGSVYGVVNPDAPYKVVIEAHADEISWMVSYITKDGFLKVIRNGGSDHIIAPSKRVNISTKDGGQVRGVFGWPAIHTRRGAKDSKLVPTVENIFIDVGAKDKEEVESMGIRVGSIVTYPDELEIMNNRYYVGRALDNRIGGFCIAEVARLIHESGSKLPFGLYIVNSVQEEVGLKGATMMADTIKPDMALVIDVSHDTHTPLVNTEKHGDTKSGRGADISIAPAAHNNVLKLMFEVAEEKGIPYQLSAASRSTGTDLDAFAYSNGGVPAALMSLPLRYMHTTVEMVHKDDVENLIRLMFETVMKVENGQDFRYFT